MADGVGEESIAVSPTSLRAAASGFDEKAKEITGVRKEMLGRREMVTLNGYDIDLNITAFQTRFETAMVELNKLEAVYEAIADEMRDAASDAEAADAAANWESTVYLPSPEGAFKLEFYGPPRPDPDPDDYNNQVSSPLPPPDGEFICVDVSSEEFLVAALTAAGQLYGGGGAGFSYRSAMRGHNEKVLNNSLLQLGLNPDEEIPAWKAEKLADKFAKEFAASSERSRSELKVLVATTLADARLVEGDEQQWLGEYSASLIDPMLFAPPTRAEEDLVEAVAEALSTRAMASVAFYTEIGLEGASQLPDLAMGDQDPNPANGQPSNATRAFATSLALATRHGDIGFTGADLATSRPSRASEETDESFLQLFPEDQELEPAIDPLYLFATDERFDPEFAIGAATTEIRQRNSTPAPNPKTDDDSPVVFAIEAVLNNGPETTADFIDELDDDTWRLFRSRAPITDYDHTEGEILSRVVESLGQSDLYENGVEQFVVSYAGASTNPLDPAAADLTAATIQNLIFDPDKVAETDQQLLIDAITATYRGGNRTLAEAEIATFTGAAETAWALQADPLHGYLDAQGPRDTYQDGGLTTEYLEQSGTRLGILMLGRAEADRLDARTADEAAELNAHMLSLGSGTLIGSIPIIPPPVGAMAGELSSEFAAFLFPADAEFRNLEGQLVEKAGRANRMLYLVAHQLAEAGVLIGQDNEPVTTDQLLDTETGYDDIRTDYLVQLGTGENIAFEKWVLDSNIDGLWRHWSAVELDAYAAKRSE